MGALTTHAPSPDPPSPHASRDAAALMSTHQARFEERWKIKELVEFLFRCRFEADIDVLRPFMAPDIVYRMIGCREHSPFSGEFHGPDAVVEGERRLNAEFAYQNMTIDHILIDGEHIGIRWHGSLRNHGTNATGEFEGFAHLEIVDGFVKSYTNFIDTALMADISGWES